MKFTQKLILLIISSIVISCQQDISLKENKFTDINPLSYTDVIYKSKKDTVLVSTFSGEIFELIKNKPSRKPVANIPDEIYNLAYNSHKKQIYASTLESGILIIDELSGKIIKSLPIKETWAYDINYNPVSHILSAYDFKGNSYIWDTANDFEAITVPQEIKKLKPRFISNDGNIYFNGINSINTWNIKSEQVFKTVNVSGKLVDVDSDGNYLLLQNKHFKLYNSKDDSLRFLKSHPDWPIYVESLDSLFRIPLSLTLTLGRLTENNIYTTGIDKSIRKWNKSNGNLIKDMIRHNATISAMDISEDESQLVSVDLKGQVEFWSL